MTFIRKSADSLLEMVNDLLDLARVEAGKSVVRPARFQAANLFGALRGVLRPLQVNEARGADFRGARGHSAMYTDESKVAQILRNFVSNAFKFTEQGEVRVSAKLVRGREDRRFFRWPIRGSEFAPDQLDYIFQEFAQVDTPMQNRFKGTGLGLPLSKGLAELLGGRVGVESRVGQGLHVLRRDSDSVSRANSRSRRAGTDWRRGADHRRRRGVPLSDPAVPGPGAGDSGSGRRADRNRHGEEASSAGDPARPAHAGDERIRGFAGIEGGSRRRATSGS